MLRDVEIIIVLVVILLIFSVRCDIQASSSSTFFLGLSIQRQKLAGIIEPLILGKSLFREASTTWVILRPRIDLKLSRVEFEYTWPGCCLVSINREGLPLAGLVWLPLGVWCWALCLSWAPWDQVSGGNKGPL